MVKTPSLNSKRASECGRKKIYVTFLKWQSSIVGARGADLSLFRTCWSAGIFPHNHLQILQKIIQNKENILLDKMPSEENG